MRRLERSSRYVPDNAAIAAEGLPWPRRRRRSLQSRAARGSVPYLLILPVVGAIALILGYPLYSMIRLSFERYGLFELIKHAGPSVGLHNYGSILHDPVFWHTLVRTAVFTVVNVALTMVLGTLIALLLVRVSTAVRILLTSGLVLAWSMPAVVAVQVWIWMTNLQNGVLNYALTQLHIGDYSQHDWFGSTLSQLGMVTTLIVWGAIPFVVVTVYAGLAQVPAELVEAAEVDGARPWRVFLDVTYPILKPIFLILTSLSIIWDFGVFTQPYLLIEQSKLHAGNYLMAIYLFEEGYFKSDFGRGAAISILMLLMVAAMSVFYVRRMVKMGDVR
ncbi:MAG: sugar ABC transporter permease [Actinobacteria bacterium]|nr:MAG: sugar ABC transporter permease [Actinomycetota bacterium]